MKKDSKGKRLVKADASLQKKVSKQNAEEIIWQQALVYLKSRDKKQEYEGKMEASRDLAFLAMDALAGKGQPARFVIEEKDKEIVFGRFQWGGGEIIDPETLQELLTDEQWEAVTNRVLDKEKLSQAVSEGLIPTKVVEQASQKQEPSLRILAKRKGQKLTKQEEIAPLLQLPKR